jgi:hypothetical protein
MIKGKFMELNEKKNPLSFKCWRDKHKEGTKMKGGKLVNNCVPNESFELSSDEMFDMIESTIEEYASENGFTSEYIWDIFDVVSDDELLEYAIDAKGHKSSTGGLTQKGVDAYRKENPGSKLQMAVTTPPSKLDPDSKAAKRRKSFCARMSGVSGPMKDKNGKPTRKALALKKWNC